MAIQRKGFPHLPPSKKFDDLVGAQGKDFSGRDLFGVSLIGQNFFESIFNGCWLKDSRVTQSIFQHTEFTEARIADCVFEDTSFDHSDFVLTNIDNCEFVRCSFQNAEWRDSIFYDVRFRQCIFRNTTTSSIQFLDCSFDDASSASFVGKSKRYTLFSNTKFFLPVEHVDFLRSNFGISGLSKIAVPLPSSDDALYVLSLLKYNGVLTPNDLYSLLIASLKMIVLNDANLDLLRLRYIGDICKTCLEEGLVSVFAIQLLAEEISKIASQLSYTEQILEVAKVILTLRVCLNERITEIEKEVSKVPDLAPSPLRILLEFDADFSSEAVGVYLEQLASFSSIPRDEISIVSVKYGSTIAEVFIAVAAYIPHIVRFIKYSLTFATTTIVQVGKLRKAYTELGEKKRVPMKKTRRKVGQRTRKQLPAQTLTKELSGRKTKEAESVEILVNVFEDKILVVNGPVKVTISTVS